MAAHTLQVMIVVSVIRRFDKPADSRILLRIHAYLHRYGVRIELRYGDVT